MKKLIVLLCMVLLSVGGMVNGACPRADITGDCEVTLEDFAIMASEWLDIGVPLPVLYGMTWVSINDSGAGMKKYIGKEDYIVKPISHGGFIGEMSKYETTNAQYCQFLNAALASGDIYVSSNRAYGANGSNPGADFVDKIYFDTYAADSDSQITYNEGVFSVRSRDGYDMSNHPVVEVSWYGATAFCNYYGFILPSEWMWLRVADYDGSYIYGCGTTIDSTKANYDGNNPLGLSSPPYTTPVDYYPSYGYGINDMAGNVGEWTSSITDIGGSWHSYDWDCTVSYPSNYRPSNSTSSYVGFRVYIWLGF